MGRGLAASLALACLAFGWSAVVHDHDASEPSFYELKCSACCSVVAELERNLETEKPRMNVDLRRTLAGGRAGKVVDYAVSELRTLEVLEGVCAGMGNYGVTKLADGSAGFQRHGVSDGKVHIQGSMTIGTLKYTTDKQRLTSYCDALVEDHEDLLAEAIRAAGVAALRARQEERRAATADSRGDADADPHVTLGVVRGTSIEGVRQAYRALSRALHPDKTGGDPALLRRFVAIADAYERLSGEARAPYADLYREVCVDIVGVCADETEVDAAKRYFPRYTGSLKFNKIDGVVDVEQIAPARGADAPRKKKRKKKRSPAAEP